MPALQYVVILVTHLQAAYRALNGIRKGGDLAKALAETPFRSVELEMIQSDLDSVSCQRIMVLSFVQFYGPAALERAFQTADEDNSGSLEMGEIGPTLVNVLRESVTALRKVLVEDPRSFAELCSRVGLETKDPPPP